MPTRRRPATSADRFEAVAALATEAGTTGLMAIVGERVLYEYGDVAAVSWAQYLRMVDALVAARCAS